MLAVKIIKLVELLLEIMESSMTEPMEKQLVVKTLKPVELILEMME